MNDYILFKNPIQYDTLSIVQYLFTKGIDVKPKMVIERNYPNYITETPSIYIIATGQLYQGLDLCIEFYEMISNIDNLLIKAGNFKNTYPNFRISG